MKRLHFFVIAFFMTLPLCSSEFDDQKDLNWHQWRGPNATGVAPHGDPPIEWSDSKNIKWKAPIPGDGDSTPIIWGDQVFLLTAIKTDKTDPQAKAAEPAASDAPPPRRRGGMGASKPTNIYQFVVLCYERNTGKIQWQKTAVECVPHEGHHGTGTFASASPSTDGKYLYAFFGSRGIYCYDLAGELQWSRDLGDMQITNSFGEGASPALYKDSLIVNWDHEGQSFITNLDAKTGEPKWTMDRDEPTSWSTPLIVEYNGNPQIIINATNKSRGYDLNTGKVLWESGGQTRNVIPASLALDKSVICMSGFRGSAMQSISLDSTGDVTGTDKVLWSYNKDTPYTPSALLYGTSLYFTKTNGTTLTCLNAETGQPIIEGVRLPDMMGTIYSSPVGAANRIYLMTRDGKFLVIKHGPQLEILANNKLNDEFSASPAVAGKQLFLRGREFLYCIEE